MKRALYWLAIIFGTALLPLALLCGCAPGKLFTRQTNVIERVLLVTNAPPPGAVPSSSPILTVTKTPDPVAAPPEVRAVTNFVTNVLVTVSTPTTEAIDAAKRVNAALPANPVSPMVDLGLGLAASILGGLAAYKTRQANRRQAVLETVVRGVEAAGNPDTKASINAEARDAGTQSDLHAEVTRLTK